MPHQVYIPSPSQPGRELAPQTLYTWFERAAGDVAHAFRGGAGWLRSVCGWQRWTITSVIGAGSSHCRDCMTVVEYELAEAHTASIDPERERVMVRAARIADEADWTETELAAAWGDR